MATLQYDSFNETRQYNALQQLIGATVTGNGTTVMNMQYGYSPAQNNGRILQSIDAVLSETVNYTYDSLNRLSTAISTSGSMNQQFSYDGFGNLTGTQGTAVWSFDPSRNAPKGAVDASGNANLAGYQWNVENRLIGEPTAYGTKTIIYDPWGKRVMEYGGGLANPLVTMYSINSITGQRLQMYQEMNDGEGDLWFVPSSGENVYFGGKMIRSQGVTVATDRLGSVRGNANGERMAYLPYGQERGNPTTPDGREKFGTYWRDSTIGVDYADQRYYAYQGVGSWPAGRFLSPDAGGISTADPTKPASWNRYTYATGDPINFNDPQGLEDMSADCGDDDSCDDGDYDDDLDDGGGGGGGGDPCANSAATFCTTTTAPMPPNPNPTPPSTALADPDGVLTTLLNWVLTGAGTIVRTGVGLIALPTPTSGTDTLSSNPNYYSPEYIEANCTPVGNPVIVPSTNYPDGKSVEQEYVCPDGQPYTIHILYKKSGLQKEKHSRPGKPKYGPQ